MKIIKESDIRKAKALKQFECNKCGCVFEAEKGEYEADTQYNETYYYCECPCCGKSVLFKKT